MFNIGDRVRVIKATDERYNETGIIRDISYSFEDFPVAFADEDHALLDMDDMSPYYICLADLVAVKIDNTPLPLPG